MAAAFAPRVWSTANLDRRLRRHIFFVLRGYASFIERHGADIDLKAPFILWLPRSSLGEFRLEAGGEGVALSILEDFVWRTVGDSGVAMTLRPLLDRIVIATSDRIAPHLDELETSFSALVRESHDPQPGASVMMGLHLGIVLLRLWRASGTRRAEPASQRRRRTRCSAFASSSNFTIARIWASTNLPACSA